MAESENVYVKIGERGRLIERTANTPRDHVNFKARGWVLKGSKGAPTKKDETADAPVTSGLTEVVPTSVKALADAADAEPDNSAAKKPTTTGRGSSSAGDAGAAADAKSQAAAGV